MHLGVPCLVSDVVGCQRDLVHPGETGWIFPAGDPVALSAVLRTALRATPGEIRRLGHNCIQTAGRYTFAQASEGLQQAIASLGPASRSG